MADLPPLGTTAVEVGADSSRMDRAFREEIPRKAREGAARAGQAWGSEFEKRLVEAASRTPEQVVPKLRAGFERDMSRLRVALARGIIDPAEFDRSSKEAADNFRRNLTRAAETLEKRGLLSDRIRRDFNREMSKLGDQGGNTLADRVKRGLTGGLSGLRGVLAATIAGAVVFAGVQAVQAAARIARRIAETLRAGIERGSQVQQRRQAFSSLAGQAGIDQTELLQVLRRETRLLVADFDLLRQANFALQAGLPATAEQLGELANIARRTARAVGRDATDAYDRLINSIAKGERRVLDELGIIVSFDQAHRDFADSIGKTRDELTAQEQIQARLNVVLEAGREKIEQLGTETLTAAERLTQLETVFGDIRDRTLELLVQSPTVVRFFEQIGIFAEDAGDRIDELAVKIGAFTLAATESLKDVVDLLQLISSPVEFGIRLQEVEDFSERRARFEAELNAVLAREREIDAIRRESNRVALHDRLQELDVQARQLQMQRRIGDERRAQAIASAHGRIVRGQEIGSPRLEEEGRIRLNELIEEGSQLERERASATDELRQIESERVEVQGQLNRLTGEGRRELEETEETARSLKDILRETRAQLRLIGQIKIGEPVIELRTSLQRQADSLKLAVDTLFPEIEGRIERQIAAGAPEAVKLRQFRAAAEEVLKSTAPLGEQMLALQAVFQEFGLTAEDLPPFLRELAEEMGLLETRAGDAGDEVSALEETLDGIERGARGLLRVADAAGVLTDDIRNALEGAVELSSAIRDIAANGLSFGNIAQGIGGAISLVSGFGDLLFGESRASEEAKELRAALNRLRDSVDRMGDLFAQTTGVVTTGLERLAGIDPLSLAGNRAAGEFLDPERLRAELRSLGLTISDLEQFASDAGIPLDELIGLLDGTGGSSLIAAGEFRGLQDAILLAAEAARTFQEDLATLDLEFELFDIDDPAEQFGRIIDTALERGFSEAGARTQQQLAGLEGLDLSDPADVERAREIFQSIFRDIEAVRRGDLAATDVFGGLTRPELERLLRDGNALLERILEEEGIGLDTGRTQQGGVFRGVSIGQGDALIALGQTEVALLQDIAISTRTLAGRDIEGFLFQPFQLGQPVPNDDTTAAPGQPVTGAGAPNAPTPPEVPRGTPGLSSTSLSVSVGSVSLGGVTVEGANVTDADSLARNLAGLTGRRMSEMIEDNLRDRLENRGLT